VRNLAASQAFTTEKLSLMDKTGSDNLFNFKRKIKDLQDSDLAKLTKLFLDPEEMKQYNS
jgi:hypothetical protein